MNIIEKLAKELNIKASQAEAAVKLLDEGNTVPFVARYRKEATGGLDDETLRNLSERLNTLRAVEDRREDVHRLISEQGKMTPEIEKALSAAESVAEIDDIYRPYRPKRRTRASVAVEKGLEPLAEILLSQEKGLELLKAASEFINEEKGVLSAEDALAGARDIIAERVSDSAEFRKWIRDYTYNNGLLVSKAKQEEDSVYRLYYDFSEALNRIPSHRTLAINRGEREGFLSVKVEVGEEKIISFLKERMCKKDPAPSTTEVAAAVEDAYKRLIAPSVENEVRGMISDRAEEQAIEVFKDNLKSLLLQPPVRGKVVMGFDPAYRTGCKVAVVNELGDVLVTTVVYPTPPQNKTQEAKRILTNIINTFKVDIISIGNGTASNESEIFIADLLKGIERKVSYIITNEAGASVYSASKLGSEEFPEYDVSLRSAISIARRLQDPLAELVKIDPKSIGVGQYQHDLDSKKLGDSLGGVVESCVSSVGADLNTASVSLLSHIAGINSKIARNIYDYRVTTGRFERRSDLKNVKGIGEKVYTQCAGFLRVPESKEVLDNTAVHPESYEAAKKLLKLMGYTEADVKDRKVGELEKRVSELGWENVAARLNIGEPTLRDIVSELLKPGRDPRDELPKPILRTDVMDITSLKPGMELTGTVRNVTDFGAFVDIGVHQDGLIHISRLSERYVKRARDVVSIGDIIKVRVIEVDVEKKRISLEKVG
ncbi:MAG TPA: RNA-binding transcriptional accessory protein [Clostridiales bacterium]|nr:RNA-binding transcriptional accessory protein [Clostridiales bacterium]